MCGIFGAWRLDSRALDLVDVERATTLMRHRGPDDEGYFLGDTRAARYVHAGGNDTPPAAAKSHIRDYGHDAFDLAFGFRRLSILDLSPAGHQPMVSEDGRFCMVFNGEVYNFRELRAQLTALGHRFRGGSDTEVILASFLEWGPACLHRFNGMWAIAIWDAPSRRLFLARDRFGVKPLFYSATPDLFAFASEIKALHGMQAVPVRPSDSAIYDYLQTGQLPSPLTGATFFEGVTALPPGCCMEITPARTDLSRYYELPSEYAAPPARPHDVVDEYRSLFEDSIRLRLRADVPVGTCLSGGVDSSSIVCVLNRMLGADGTDVASLGDRQQTFSAVYDSEGRYNERPYIDTVLEATRAQGNFVIPTAEWLQADITKLVWHQDEPFGSTSIFAQWCVMSKVKECGVTVLLDGQGADEALAGYRPFDVYTAHLLRRGRLVTMMLAGRDIRRVSGAAVGPLVARALVRQLPDRWLSRLRGARTSGATQAMRPDFAANHATAPRYEPVNRDLHQHLLELIRETSLPHLLRYEDRNSMAFGVEGRVPFLDYRLVELSLREAFRWCIHEGWSKWVLREAMRGIVPDRIIWRRDKVGFETPERQWQADFLRAQGMTLFGAGARSGSYLDLAAVRQRITHWLQGGGDDRLIWRWLNLELWLRNSA
jgi:asparagine synthase (glutamine-hydrolysing)